MQIGVIGLNHKQAQIEVRESLAKVCLRRFNPGQSLQPFILLTTCNRTEIYFSSTDLAVTHSTILNILKNDIPFEIGQELYSFFGIDCFYHLCKVTSGFDSATLAETEIQGQVKTSYQQAHQFLSLPFELHYLFQKALKVGKELRNRCIMPKAIDDIEQAILHFAKKTLPLPDASLLLVGASRTNLKVASFLKSKNIPITITNRTNEKAIKIARVEGFSYLPWQEIKRWTSFDWVIVATKAETYQLNPSDLHEEISTQLLIDLSVPRNINPKIELPIINIDQINALLYSNSVLTQEKLDQAENYLLDASKKYFSLFHEKTEKLYAFA